MQNKTKISFSALNPFIEKNKIENVEKEVSSQSHVLWGVNDKYPSYLQDLFINSSTLQSIINTVVDFVCGDEVASTNSYISDEEIEDVIKEIALSYCIFGGFALNVLRNQKGDICKLCPMDFKKLRVSKDGSTIFYAPEYDKKAYSRYNWLKYEVFDKDKKQNSSIFYYKNSKYTNYPIPIWSAAISAAQMEVDIDTFHLNSLNNGFTGSVIVNLCNGIPTDEVKNEIEEMFNEKFSGKDNAGRIVLSYSEDKEHSCTIEKIDTEDFSERYKSLNERCKESLFTSFRCTPTLVGIPTENNGFSSEQYNEQFKIFNRTVIRPIQKTIIKTLKCILSEDYFTIKPFSIDFNDTTKEEKEV